jgi:cysteinyl-tRNA synthetase
MSIKYLGEMFDIHAGGIDHIPVPHTNEIAQSEAATGKHPWVKYWVHNEFLVLDKGKMSKSAGGFLTLQTLIDSGYDPLDYRYLLLGAHYRSQLQFSFPAMDGAKSARKSLCEKIRSLAAQAGYGLAGGKSGGKTETAGTAEYLAGFNKALEDDLSTPRALAELWGLLRDPSISPKDALAAALDMDGVLGLRLAEEAAPRPESENLSAEEEVFVKKSIEERNEAKKAKNFKRADEIRAMLKEKGIILEDSPSGTSWHRLPGFGRPTPGA